MPSSMLTSSTWAPFSTCWRATTMASSKRPSRISFLNCALPVTLVRSPMLMKLDSGVICSGSRPERRVWRGRAVISALGSIRPGRRAEGPESEGGVREGRPSTAARGAYAQDERDQRAPERESGGGFQLRQRPRGHAPHRLGDRADVVGRGAAAAADQIEQSGLGEFLQYLRHVLGRLVVAAEGIG